MTGTDLRSELGAQPDPEFEMELPPGWSRRTPDKQTQEQMVGTMKQRFMKAHRPDLFAEAKAMVDQVFDDMRAKGVFAFFSADSADSDALFIPASLNASIRKAEPGETLDDVVRGLIQNQGATALFNDKRTIRFEHETQARLGTDTIINHTVVYLTPVPGAKRRRALQLVAGFGRSVDTPADHPSIASMRALFDACVASVRWRPASRT